MRALWSAFGASGEIRLLLGLFLQTLKSPTSPVYTFPTTERLLGQGVGGALYNIDAAGTVISFSPVVGPITRNVNIEALYPNFIGGHQADVIAGPSEKIILNLKRLRALGFDTARMTYATYYANAQTTNQVIPFELALYKGGYPQVIAVGAQDDWDFPGSTLLVKETLVSRQILPVFTQPTRDYVLTFDLSLARRHLIFYP